MVAEEILQKVCTCIDVLINVGRKYHGLFPSLLDLDTHEMLSELPEAIAGQRVAARAHLGSNLLHDQTTLFTMFGLAETLGRTDYAEAGNKYLEYFAKHCTDSPTGLFPWGEHAYWHLIEDRKGDSVPDPGSNLTHDHLLQVPLWLWEKLYEYNPVCVERFCEGLEFHYTDSKPGEPLEYMRHAYIEKCQHYPRNPQVSEEYYPRFSGARDFPRHSGFYIFDWCFGYVKTGREDFLKQIIKMADYWWTKRNDDGSLPFQSRMILDDPAYHTNGVSQTISLGISLLESALMLDNVQPDLALEMRTRGKTYIDSFFNVPYDFDSGIIVGSYRADLRKVTRVMSLYGSEYGEQTAAIFGGMTVCAYRLTNDDRLLDWAQSLAKLYIDEPFPANKKMPVLDVALVLGMLADIYDITHEQYWLDDAMSLTERIMPIYFDKDLPRGASGIDWYESQMNPAILLHALARTALLTKDRDNCLLGTDYTYR